MRYSVNNTKKLKYVLRLILSRILNKSINILLNINLSDALTGIFIVKKKLFFKLPKKTLFKWIQNIFRFLHLYQ